MGYWTGRVSVFGTGAQTLNTGLVGAPTWCRVICGGGSGDTINHGSVGTCDGTRQNVQYWSPSSSGSNNTDLLLIKNAAGTTQLELSWSSFGTSGGNGTVPVSVGTWTTGFQFTLEVGN